MRTWQRINAWAGYVVFGLPAVLAVPALLATVDRFGVWATLTRAVPAALGVCLPLLLWIRWNRRPARTRTGRLAWAVLLLLAAATVLLSPLAFWVGPALLVLASAAARAATERSGLPERLGRAMRRRSRPEQLVPAKETR